MNQILLGKASGKASAKTKSSNSKPKSFQKRQAHHQQKGILKHLRLRKSYANECGLRASSQGSNDDKALNVSLWKKSTSCNPMAVSMGQLKLYSGDASLAAMLK
jgi:hypothetical protein